MLHFNLLASFANDNDALIPEIWARESIAVLEENMVMAQLVHRDHSEEIKDFGDIVHTRKPSDMEGDRRTDTDTVSYEDAVVTNVQVPLDQWFLVPFVIKDGERSKSMQDLIQVHLVPAMKAMGNNIDRAILGRMAHSLLGGINDRVGRLGALSSANAYDTTLEAREVLNRSLAHTGNRNLVLAPGSETAMLKTELFAAANQRGDGGTALEEARLGRIAGFDTFMDQNVNGVLSNASRDTFTGATSAAIAAGASGALAAVDLTSRVLVVGEFLNIAGNDQPTWVTAETNAAGDTTSATLNEELKNAVASGAVITVYNGMTVNGAFASGYTKYINIDGHAANKGPVVGQLLAFGTTTGTRHTYTVIRTKVISTTETQVLLDRPLDSALADNDGAFPGPAGDFNVAFHRNAFAFVNRPLAPATEGARSFVATHNGVSMRVTMQYDIDVGGTKVVLDLLAGTQLLDANLATLLLG